MIENKLDKKRFLIDMYVDICKHCGIKPAVSEEELQQLSYLKIKELIKTATKAILPIWKEKVDDYFFEEDRKDNYQIIDFSMVNPETCYYLFRNVFDTLDQMKKFGPEEALQKVREAAAFFSIEELVYNYDFILGSIYGPEIYEAIMEGLKNNQDNQIYGSYYFQSSNDNIEYIKAKRAGMDGFDESGNVLTPLEQIAKITLKTICKNSKKQRSKTWNCNF